MIGRAHAVYLEKGSSGSGGSASSQRRCDLQVPPIHDPSVSTPRSWDAEPPAAVSMGAYNKVSYVPRYAHLSSLLIDRRHQSRQSLVKEIILNKQDMKLTLATLAATVGVANAAVQGFDISNWQESVDFAGAYSSGARFVIIKATEGTNYIDPSFNSHYQGATDAGLIRGGYHFAHPDSSSGAEQASYFLSHGGGWSNDGITLPGMLDIETNPNGDQCYGLSASSMVAWIQEFVDTYQGKTGRYPMIYTSPSWWQSCTGDSGAFADTCPLVMARWASSPGTPPGGWTYTIWQYTDKYEFGGDGDLFNGDEAGLKKLATG